MRKAGTAFHFFALSPSPICHNFSMSISAMTTKMVAVLRVAALGAFASPALAELICGEAVSDGSYASEGGSSARIVYEVDTRAWVIEHHLPNGQVVFRGDQYDVTDERFRAPPVGRNAVSKSPAGHDRRGRRFTATGEPTYNERPYDDAKRGALVLYTVVLCRFEKPASLLGLLRSRQRRRSRHPRRRPEARPRSPPLIMAKPALTVAVDRGCHTLRQRADEPSESRRQNWRRNCSRCRSRLAPADLVITNSLACDFG